MEPTIGRIVIYRMSEGDVPAIITATKGRGLVDLSVFEPGVPGASAVTNVGHDPLPPGNRIAAGERTEPLVGHWRWPERS